MWNVNIRVNVQRWHSRCEIELWIEKKSLQKTVCVKKWVWATNSSRSSVSIRSQSRAHLIMFCSPCCVGVKDLGKKWSASRQSRGLECCREVEASWSRRKRHQKEGGGGRWQQGRKDGGCRKEGGAGTPANFIWWRLPVQCRGGVYMLDWKIFSASIQTR